MYVAVLSLRTGLHRVHRLCAQLTSHNLYTEVLVDIEHQNMVMPINKMHSVWPPLQAEILVTVLVSLARRDEEITGFHMSYCGPLGVNLSTFRSLKLNLLKLATPFSNL